MNTSILIAAASLVVCVYLLIKVSDLSYRLDQLEQSITDTVQGNLNEKQKEISEDSKKEVETKTKKNLEQKTAKTTDSIFDWFKQDWPMKLGALLLLIGFGWLTSYAFMEGWIGPAGRIAMGVVGGAFILFFGEWRIKSYHNQGAVLLGLGAATLLVSTFAAREVYGFFNPTIALGFMSLVVIFVSASSVQNDSKALAILGIILGGVAPLLTSATDPSFIGLFAYLFLLSAGILWVIGITGWRVLTPLSLAVVFVYSLPYMVGGVENVTTALIFAFLFTFLYYVANLTAIVYEKKSTTSDLITAAANGVFILAWISSTAPDQWKSLLTLALTLVFVLGVFIINRITKLKTPLYIYGGVAVGMFAATTAFELSNQVLTIAYTLEAGVVAFLAAYLSGNVKLGQKSSGLLVVPAVMSISSIQSNAWQSGIMHYDFFVLLVLTLTLLVLGSYFYYKQKIAKDSQGYDFNFLFWLFGLYGVALVWKSFHAIITNPDIATMVSLTIYTIVGLIIYILGKAKEKRDFLFAGGVVLAGVAIRLLLVDVWNMGITGRIITFFLIGVLFVSTAFVSKNSFN